MLVKIRSGLEAYVRTLDLSTRLPFYGIFKKKLQNLKTFVFAAGCCIHALGFMACRADFMLHPSPHASLGWRLVLGVPCALLYLTALTTDFSCFRRQSNEHKSNSLVSKWYVLMCVCVWGGCSRPLKEDCLRFLTQIVTCPINLHLTL